MSEGIEWTSHSDPASDCVHVIPDDGCNHYASMDCPCEPDIELLNRPDESVSTVYMHKIDQANIDTVRQYREPPNGESG